MKMVTINVTNENLECACAFTKLMNSQLSESNYVSEPTNPSSNAAGIIPSTDAQKST